MAEAIITKQDTILDLLKAEGIEATFHERCPGSLDEANQQPYVMCMAEIGDEMFAWGDMLKHENVMTADQVLSVIMAFRRAKRKYG